MKKLVFFTALFTVLPLLLFPEMKIYAQTLEHVHIYKVEQEDSFHDIGMKFGVPELQLEEMNPEASVEEGEKIIIPQTITNEEKDLLARLVTAEAKGEPYKGKVAVATVVLNRVDDNRYPDSVEEVIYEENQFQPVENGMINKPATKEAKKAVNEALVLNGQDKGSLNFYNPDLVESEWHRSQTITGSIGNHVFSK